MKMSIHIILISTLLIESHSQIQCSFGAISNPLSTAHSFEISSVLCSEDDMMYIDIEYTNYANNWFGIVFSADMAGYALCYTTGQDSQTSRQLALYQYTLTNTDRTATYNPNHNWIKVSETINNNAIRIIYKKELSLLPYSILSTTSIPISYAFGEGTLILGDHDKNGGENKNDYILTFTITPTPSPTTSVPTTSTPTTVSTTTSVPTSIPTTANPSTNMPTTSIPTTSFPTTSVPTQSRVEICPRGGIEAALNIANKLQIYGTLCNDNMIYIDIMYSNYNNNYFGIVFDSDNMYGDALIYTTGKYDETTRNKALYAYNMKEISSRIDGVIYVPNDNWIQVLINETNGGINVIYKQILSNTLWDMTTESIKIGYAIGNTLVLDTHNERNNANAAYILRFTKETITTPVTTAAATTGSNTDINNKECEKQNLVETTATLDAFTVTLDINCDTNTVDVTIVYSEYNNNWFGIVFNDKMIGHTLIYTTGKSSETIRDIGLYPYTNEGYGINNVLYNGVENNWIKISQIIENGVLSVHYQQYLDKTEIFSLETEEIYFKWAKGDNSLVLSQHAEGALGRAEKSQKMDLLTGETTVVKDDLTLEITHGILMWLAWAVFASIGIMSSAFRFLYPNGPIWFYIHQGMQICVISFHIIAFMIALVFTERNGKPHFNNSHSIIGLVVTILCVTQPINALFRAHPPPKGWPNGVKSTKRIIWEYIHKMFGYVVWILGCVTAMLGMLLIGEVILAYIHMFLWCGLLLIIYIILYVVKITRAKKESQVESVNKKEKLSSDGHESEDPMLDTNETKN